VFRSRHNYSPDLGAALAANQPDGQIISFLPKPRSRPEMKNILFFRTANQWHQYSRLTRQEGRIAIVTNVRWDAVDADVAPDERG
jgi:hypothetical protein